MNMGIKVTETLQTILPMFEERTCPQTMVKIPSTLDMPQVLTAALSTPAPDRTWPGAISPAVAP
ncbi:hypothetical protein [Methylocella silvestris]|uniref:hypothetical protein n=1 Tax=Methylocella silvestris TaxID=199596 RepID=UPI0015E07F42|nr:hypothetical protein [Methylocella silvestris]